MYITLTLTWSEKGVISSATGGTKFAITEAKRIPVVTFSTQYNRKLFELL